MFTASFIFVYFCVNVCFLLWQKNSHSLSRKNLLYENVKEEEKIGWKLYGIPFSLAKSILFIFTFFWCRCRADVVLEREKSRLEIRAKLHMFVMITFSYSFSRWKFSSQSQRNFIVKCQLPWCFQLTFAGWFHWNYFQFIIRLRTHHRYINIRH